jgi:EpsI family protein
VQQKRRIAYLAIAAIMIGLSAILMQVGKEVEPQILKKPIAEIPLTIGSWHAVGKDRKLDERTLDILKPQKYLLRNYVAPSGRVASLFVAYFGIQKEGQMIHSPRACLPGGGWIIESKRLIEVPVQGGSRIVNHLTIGKDLSKISALYWYQGRGKVESSEYWERLSLLIDGVLKNRNDGSLVRLTAPLSPNDPGAPQRLVELAAQLIPEMEKILP